MIKKKTRFHFLPFSFFTTTLVPNLSYTCTPFQPIGFPKCLVHINWENTTSAAVSNAPHRVVGDPVTTLK